MPGQILNDRYEVERQLGRKLGRWTLVAQDLQNQQRVILKLLFIDEHLTPVDLRLFKREVEALKHLHHPLTPQYLDYFELDLPKDGRALALVQTYMEGTSLAYYLEQQRLFSETEMRIVARHTLSILDALHNYQPPIIHRDIRPSNLLLLPSPAKKGDPTVFLVDFGTVKSFATDNTSLTMIGTDGYIPPEQMGGRAMAVSDLYSLGATLVHCLTGTPPASLPRRNGLPDFASVVSLSPPFADWLNRLLSPNLEKRWSSAAVALEALEALPK